MEHDNDGIRLIVTEDSVHQMSTHLAQTISQHKDFKLQALPLPCVQDQRPSRCAVNNRPLNKLRDVDQTAQSTRLTPLDQAWCGTTDAIG